MGNSPKVTQVINEVFKELNQITTAQLTKAIRETPSTGVGDALDELGYFNDYPKVQAKRTVIGRIERV